MAVSVKEVLDRKELKKFIHFPAQLHNGHASWIPPIYQEEWNFYNPSRNRAFSYCDTILGLAYRNGRVAGRIMGIINRRYNSIHNENHARFEFMECINDQETGHALISYVENWAGKHGADKMIGPLGFSDKEPQGFLISGFEHQAIMDTACNFPYMTDIIEKEGYVKSRDLGNYLIDIPAQISELYLRVYRSVTGKNKFMIREFKKRTEMKPYIVPVLRLMNETYNSIYGFVPMEEDEMIEFAHRYIAVLDPDFIKLIIKDDDVIGFAIAIPDISAGLKKSGGYLFPIGIFHILRSLKKSSRLVVFLGAIKPRFRGMGIDAVLTVKILESAISRGMKFIESHLILDSNTKMIGEVEKNGGKPYKRFRIYEKNLY